MTDFLAGIEWGTGEPLYTHLGPTGYVYLTMAGATSRSISFLFAKNKYSIEDKIAVAKKNLKNIAKKP